MSKNSFSTISDAVTRVIDGYPAGHQFRGYELKNDVVKMNPEYKDVYVDTFLRMARRHRRNTFRAIAHNGSLYEKLHVKTFLEELQQLREAESIKNNRPTIADRPLAEIQQLLFGTIA